MYKFKPFPMYFIWNNSQLLCLVNKNVGTCTYIEDRRLPSESMYVPVYLYVCVQRSSMNKPGIFPKSLKIEGSNFKMCKLSKFLFSVIG